MKKIVCRIEEEDKYFVENADFTINMFSKEQYHYTFWDKNKRKLYQNNKFTSNNIHCKGRKVGKYI